jgi:hypothetical protein
MRVSFLGAVVFGIAALVPSKAVAAPPVLVSVGQVKRHPSANWTLPPNVKAQVIEVATQPDVASDGSFFFENVKVYDTLTDLQTTWLSAFQLDPGTYYVHVSGYDESCASCPIREWSQILPVVIPKNKRPRLLAVRWQEAGHNRPGRRYYVTETLRFRVCDDASGPLVARVGQTKRVGPYTSGRDVFERRLPLAAAGCRSYRIKWRLKDRFFGVGRYTITLRVRDVEGAWSRTVRKTNYTPD